MDYTDLIVEDEELNELSKKTLGSYVRKATRSISKNSFTAGSLGGRAAGGSDDAREWKPSDMDHPTAQAYRKERDHHDGISAKRVFGIRNAVDKITKEDMDLQELSKKTLSRYVVKAHADSNKRAFDTGVKTGSGRSDGRASHKETKRWKGITRAATKLGEDIILQELSKKTLRSYLDRADAVPHDHKASINHRGILNVSRKRAKTTTGPGSIDDHARSGDDSFSGRPNKKEKYHDRMAHKRWRGIERAEKKLAEVKNETNRGNKIVNFGQYGKGATQEHPKWAGHAISYKDKTSFGKVVPGPHEIHYTVRAPTKDAAHAMLHKKASADGHGLNGVHNIRKIHEDVDLHELSSKTLHRYQERANHQLAIVYPKETPLKKKAKRLRGMENSNSKLWDRHKSLTKEEVLDESVSTDLKLMSGIEFRKKYGKTKFSMRQVIAKQPVSRNHYNASVMTKDAISGVKKTLANKQRTVAGKHRGRTDVKEWQLAFNMALDEAGISSLVETSTPQLILDIAEELASTLTWLCGTCSTTGVSGYEANYRPGSTRGYTGNMVVIGNKLDQSDIAGHKCSHCNGPLGPRK